MFAGVTTVTRDRQTNRQTDAVAIGHICVRSTAMWWLWSNHRFIMRHLPVFWGAEDITGTGTLSLNVQQVAFPIKLELLRKWPIIDGKTALWPIKPKFWVGYDDPGTGVPALVFDESADDFWSSDEPLRRSASLPIAFFQMDLRTLLDVWLSAPLDASALSADCVGRIFRLYISHTQRFFWHGVVLHKMSSSKKFEVAPVTVLLIYSFHFRSTFQPTCNMQTY